MNQGDVAVLAEEDRHLLPRGPGFMEAHGLVGQPVGFRHGVRSPSDRDLALRGRREGGEGTATGADLLADAVGGGDDALAGTPIESEMMLGRRPPARPGKVMPEGVEVVGGGTAPLVDGLVGVPHRHHGEPVPEHFLEHDPLGRVGVLILVEQHHGVTGSQALHHLRVPAEEADRGRDEVGVVDHAQAGLLGPVVVPGGE